METSLQVQIYTPWMEAFFQVHINAVDGALSSCSHIYAADEPLPSSSHIYAVD
jgi:hypothetical protein